MSEDVMEIETIGNNEESCESSVLVAWDRSFSGDEDRSDKEDFCSTREEEEDSEDLITYLEGHAGPWGYIKEIWIRTHSQRLDVLKAVSSLEYFNKYPALNSNQGLELVS